MRKTASEREAERRARLLARKSQKSCPDGKCEDEEEHAEPGGPDVPEEDQVLPEPEKPNQADLLKELSRLPAGARAFGLANDSLNSLTDAMTLCCDECESEEAKAAATEMIQSLRAIRDKAGELRTKLYPDHAEPGPLERAKSLLRAHKLMKRRERLLKRWPIR